MSYAHLLLPLIKRKGAENTKASEVAMRRVSPRPTMWASSKASFVSKLTYPFPHVKTQSVTNIPERRIIILPYIMDIRMP
jgi:hypothetical protein